ncbi:oleate hydratase, partial [Staphylococcus hominis]|uniref:oleate hydratase n=1 Tax=Staphylococcus hominis TaxID=1290 RepID=UPI001150350F
MKIAVIGAGVTGLAAAARIASQGHEVTIFEKNNNVGGRMNQLKKDGFTFDMGERTYRKPSDFYNMTSLVQGAKLKTLNHADQLIEHYIDNEKIQKLLAFQTLYIGIDPKRGPSLYSII